MVTPDENGWRHQVLPLPRQMTIGDRVIDLDEGSALSVCSRGKTDASGKHSIELRIRRLDVSGSWEENGARHCRSGSHEWPL